MFIDNESAHGKAFEYAVAASLQASLQTSLAFVVAQATTKNTVTIVDSSAAQTARRRFDSSPSVAQIDYKQAANAAVKLLKRCEPMLQNPLLQNPLSGNYAISLQADASGAAGDVRDVTVRQKESGWSCGVSVKLNNDAAKHPRLGRTFDFAQKWFKRPASAKYFASVENVFRELEKFAAIGAHWDSLGLREHDKGLQFYQPVMRALVAELLSQTAQDASVPAKLLRYFTGTPDFYKIIARQDKRTTELQTFSFDDTLGKSLSKSAPQINQVPTNQDPDRQNPVLISRLPLPTKIIKAEMKTNSLNTAHITFDNAWSISLRLHNASSQIESSLKLDLRIASAPPERLSLIEKWTT